MWQTVGFLPLAEVTTVLGPVYGVHLSSRFTAWLPYFEYAALNLAELVYPATCTGSVRNRLIIAAAWPFVLIVTVAVVIVIFDVVKTQTRRGQRPGGLLQRMLMPTVYTALLVTYAALPTASRGIFTAWRCESFGYNDVRDERRSFLVADWSIECGDPSHRSLVLLGWALLAVWPVGVFVCYTVLLARSGHAIRTERLSHLANCIRFLWADYEPRYFFWELLDMARKLSLTSFILFVDQEHGSTKVLRLFLAALVSAVYLLVLCLARPMRRADSLYLAATANLFLMLAFLSGIVIKLCADDESKTDTETTCERVVGLDSEYQAPL